MQDFKRVTPAWGDTLRLSRIPTTKGACRHGKSGVGGGIIAVSPGKFGIAVISPPLDAAGNSGRAIANISNALGGNPYAGQPR